MTPATHLCDYTTGERISAATAGTGRSVYVS